MELYRYEIDDVNDNDLQGKSFEYKTKLIEKTPEKPPQSGNSGETDEVAQPPVPSLNLELAIALKYLSIFWISLDLPLVNCEVELDLLSIKNCVLIEHHNNIIEMDFMITSTKLYVPVVTLSINDNIKFSEHLKQGFKRAIS